MTTPKLNSHQIIQIAARAAVDPRTVRRAYGITAERVRPHMSTRVAIERAAEHLGFSPPAPVEAISA